MPLVSEELIIQEISTLYFWPFYSKSTNTVPVAITAQLPKSIINFAENFGVGDASSDCSLDSFCSGTKMVSIICIGLLIQLKSGCVFHYCNYIHIITRSMRVLAKTSECSLTMVARTSRMLARTIRMLTRTFRMLDHQNTG